MPAERVQLTGDERLIRYRVRNDRGRIVTNAFFFKERRAAEFGSALREFCVDASGELRLTALLDAD